MTKNEEYKINHDYEIAVRNLNSAGWSKMTEAEIINDLQAIENKNALDNNRISAEVRAEELKSDEYGYQLDNTITVNSNKFEDIAETVKTTYHEGEHIKGDFQAAFIPEVRSQYTPEELAARSAPVPDPEIDFDGYYNHPSEIAARQAENAGLEKIMQDKEHIVEIDAQLHAEHTTNQILETYDYIALDMPSDNECGLLEEWDYHPNTSNLTASYEENAVGLENTSDLGYENDNDLSAPSGNGIESDFDIDHSDTGVN